MTIFMEESTPDRGTYLRSRLSKTAFERELNDQGMPENFDLSIYGIIKDHHIRGIKQRFGSWLRSNQFPLFEEKYLVWVSQKEREVKGGS